MDKIVKLFRSLTARITKTQITKKNLPLIILLAAVLVFIVLRLTAPAVEPLRTTARAPGVAVQIVKIVSASPTVQLFGEVETPSMSLLSAAIDAEVLAVNALEGDAVARGAELIALDDADVALEVAQRNAELAQIIARIENDQIKLRADQAALTAEQALLELARTSVARAEQLAQTNVGTQDALDQSRREQQRQLLAVAARRQAVDGFESLSQQRLAARQGAEAALARAERDLMRARIRAPFDARITEVLAARGMRARRGDGLIRLYDESKLELRAQVPSNQLAALQAALANGRTVRATASTAPDAKRIELILTRLSGNIGVGQSGVDGFFRAAGRDRLPLPGRTLEVALTLPPLTDVVLLPPDALYGNARVYRVRADGLRGVAVKQLGRRIDADGRLWLIVQSDLLQDGDQILSSRLPQAINGMMVRVIEKNRAD